MKSLAIVVSFILAEFDIVVGRYWYSSYYDEVDPLTGMTSDEKEAVRTSWKYMMKDPSGYGSIILQKYFLKYPEYLKYFPFDDVTSEDSTTKKNFLVYLNLMMYTLDSIIDNLKTNPDIMKAILEKLGRNHFKNSVRSEPFWNLRDVILDTIQPLVNKNTHIAWVKFSNMTMDLITKAIKNEQIGFGETEYRNDLRRDL